jgi:hypothetical protein
MQMLNNKLLLTLIGLVLVFGCTPRKPQPMTDRSIELMSGSRYAFARIDYYGQNRKQLELKPDEYETMRSLFRALAPIRESRAGKIEDPDYSLSYQGGMDPTQVDVKIVDNKLEYGVRNFVYIGGNAVDFRKHLPPAPDTAE